MTQRLADGGIVIPDIAVQEAQRVDCDLAAACVMLMLESSGGHNWWQGTQTEVTEAAYRDYLTTRDETGARGVGPAQLTWPAYQEAADRLGGCWVPQYNCRVGFGILANLIAEHGLYRAFGHYNGGNNWAQNPHAVRYADRALALLPTWRAIVAG